MRLNAEVDLPSWLQPVADVVEQAERSDVTGLDLWKPPPDARAAAVLVCFAEGTAGPEVLLTERSRELRSHAGQISFPGGASDPGDDDPIDTALREANEEVGLDRDSVAVFGTLPALWLVPSNFAVTPVLGYWHDRHELDRSADEVNRILHEPLERLLEPANRFTVVHSTGWRGPAFDVGTPIPLWGFTAMVLSGLFRLVGWEKPWDESVTRSLDLT
jgi:8-oxo-dGTP pyrophosphatase MutT (NUDIX family)